MSDRDRFCKLWAEAAVRIYVRAMVDSGIDCAAEAMCAHHQKIADDLRRDMEARAALKDVPTDLVDDMGLLSDEEAIGLFRAVLEPDVRRGVSGRFVS